MPLLHIRMPDGSSREEPLEGEVTVGRADGNAIVLTEGGVSRRHARFYPAEGGRVMVEDLGSANGTFVDGEQIAEPTEVGPRAQVVIGDYEISVKDSGGAAPRRRAPRPEGQAGAPGAAAEDGGSSTRAVAPVRAARATRQVSAVERDEVLGSGRAGRRPGSGAGGRARPGAGGEASAVGGASGALARRPVGSRVAPAVPTGPTLRGLTGPWANKLYPIRGTAVIGRVAGVQIQLEDESVSRRHAEVERTEDGVVLRDLGSANGTTVNGHPIEEDTLLQPGDLVSVGMIELSYEVGDEEAMNAPTRGSRSGARRGSGPRRGVGDTGGAAGGSKKRLLVVAGALVGLFAVAGIVAQLGGGDEPAGAGPGGAMAIADPTADVERLLAECRSFAATDTGTEPNWDKARAACEKARELEPINRTVIDLVQKIDREQECQKHYESGLRMVNLAREEEALEVFAKIDEKCSYYRVLKPQARNAIEAVKKKAAKDCKEYASARQWELAYPRCERFMTIACQRMSPEQLHPPVGHTLVVTGSCRGKRNCWTPKDPMYRNFLVARANVEPEAGPWMCPPIKMFDDDLELSDPRAEVRRAIRKWHQDALVIEAMELYWDGKGGESLVKLQRVRTDRQKAALHPVADELRRDIAAVENLYRIGSTSLKDRDFEKAKDAFTEALTLDAKLMREMVEKRSFYRATIETEVAKESYLGGKHWADRGDPRRACRIWKLGFGFFRGNGDLNRAAGFCSDQGARALAQVGGCGDLQTVLDFAVDGDGLDKRVAQKAEELGCAMPAATAAN